MKNFVKNLFTRRKKRTVFTATGTYTPSKNARYIVITQFTCGGGGGSGRKFINMRPRLNWELIAQLGSITYCTPHARMTLGEYLLLIATALFAWFVIAPALQWVLFSIFNFITGKDVTL